MSDKEYKRQWKIDNRQRVYEYRAKWRANNPAQILLISARDRAKAAGLDFDLTKEDIVIPALCPVFGVPMVVKTRYAPSLDRIDATLGYVKGNVQVMSKLANRMKSDATSNELERFAQWVSQSTPS